MRNMVNQFSKDMILVFRPRPWTATKAKDKTKTMLHKAKAMNWHQQGHGQKFRP